MTHAQKRQLVSNANKARMVSTINAQEAEKSKVSNYSTAHKPYQYAIERGIKV